MTRRAFTLIELIIAAVMLAVIVVSMYSAFSVGIKAWRAGSEGRDLQEIRTALLRMQKELRSSFFFADVPFKGASSEITFPLVVPSEDKDRIYVINYYVVDDRNAGCKVLMKRRTLFMDNQPIGEGEADKLIFPADSIDFEYAYELKDRLRGFEWKAVWGECMGKVPSLVKINFSLGADEDIYHKIIFVPQGALGTE